MTTWMYTIFIFILLSNADESVAENLDTGEMNAILTDAERIRYVKRQRRAVDTSKAGVTSAERIALVTEHNKFRAQVDPTASNMRFMVSKHCLFSFRLKRIVKH